ncbi:hypothetical protein Tco_0368103 [Tanacetum coccineum]
MHHMEEGNINFNVIINFSSQNDKRPSYRGYQHLDLNPTCTPKMFTDETVGGEEARVDDQIVFPLASFPTSLVSVYLVEQSSKIMISILVLLTSLVGLSRLSLLKVNRGCGEDRLIGCEIAEGGLGYLGKVMRYFEFMGDVLWEPVKKALMNAKVDEPRISDIPMVRDFIDVFPEELSMTPRRQVEFRIGLVHERTRSQVSISWNSLISLSRGSFDVIVGMDWLSKRKFVIVCYEKVVRITLEDFRSGYHQLRVPEDAIPKTIFQTRYRHFESTVMPIGSKEEHKVHVKLVLESLRKAKLYVKFSKCEFWLEEVTWSTIHIHVDPSDALSEKETVKSRRVRGMILAAQSGAFKQENVLLVGSVMDKAHASRHLVHPGADKTYYNLGEMYCKECNSGDDKLRLRWMTYLVVLADAAERPFKILERIGLVAYRLRLPEELNSVHDTFHVLNLKRCLADASLHVPLDVIKVEKTLRFVEEPIEIIDHKIKSLKHSKISLVKVHWNSKRSPKFTWEHEDYMKSKYP